MIWGALVILVFDRVIKQYAFISDAFGKGVINPTVILFFKMDQLAVQLISVLVLGSIVCIAVVHLRSLSARAREHLSAPLILIVGGGISNSIDRFLYGGVVDMFTLPGITVFNLADVALLAGAAWFSYCVWHQQSIQAR